MPSICPTPAVVQIQPTWSCNLRCRSCTYWMRPASQSKELTTAQLVGLLDALAAMGTAQVWFVDGEPLLRADLPELVSHARSRGLQTAIITNGTLLDQALARVLADAGLQSLTVSLDGPAPVHDEIRGSIGAFSKAVGGLGHAVDERRRGVPLVVRVNVTLSRLNVGHVADIAEEVGRVGVDQLGVRAATVLSGGVVEETNQRVGPPSINRPHHYSGLVESLRLRPEDLPTVEGDLRRTRMACERHGVALLEDPLLTDMIANRAVVARSYAGKGCPVVRGFLQISPDGHVVVCPMLVEHPTGLYPQQSLQEIWGNALHQRIADLVADELLPICPHCCFRLW